MSYATNAVGGSGEATLLQNIRTKVKAAVSPSYSPIADADTVLRTVQRITSSVDTGILIQAHTAFDTTGTDGRTAGIAFSNALKAQTVFSGWYGGAQTTQNVTVDEIAAPAEFCAKEKCHYVAWEAFHNTAKQMKVYTLENEQVIFFWAGDEAVYKVADEEKWNACDMAGATRITTDTDEQNGYFGYVTPSTEGKIYLMAGETGLPIGTTSSAEMCKEGLKATIFVNEIRPKKSGGLGEGSVIMITLGFMVFCTGIFLLWWFCRTEDEHRNVHAADNMAKSSMKLAQLGSPTMQNISAARSPNKARPSFVEAKRRSNQKQAAGGGKRRASMALPPGWTYHFSDDGSIYYYNENTKKSQWTCPAVAL